MPLKDAAFSTSVEKAAEYNSALRKYAAPSLHGYQLLDHQKLTGDFLFWEIDREQICKNFYFWPFVFFDERMRVNLKYPNGGTKNL